MACCRCELESIREAIGPMHVPCQSCGASWRPTQGIWLVRDQLAWVYFEPLCEHGMCSLFLIDVAVLRRLPHLEAVRCRAICKDGHQCRNGATNGIRCWVHGGGKKKRGSR